VLDVARELGQVPPPGKKALVVVFGPGLSLEMLLLAPDAD